MKRLDGRKPDELRPFSIVAGVIAPAAKSRIMASSFP